MSLRRGSTFSLINASIRHRAFSVNFQGNHARRHFLNFTRKSKSATPGRTTVLGEDDLFHPFSESPFPAVKARGEAIRSLAPCPICSSSQGGYSDETGTKPLGVKFECPDCGWPTHCSREHWEMDEDHAKFCLRLREVNEDEHDLRSGRRMYEFELPGVYTMCMIVGGKFDISTAKDLKRMRKLFHLPIGISFGIPVVSLRWTPNGRGGMRASCSPIRSP